MAKSPNIKPKSSSSGAGKTWFKNAATAFKYTTVELGSEHMPFVVGTVTKSINAFNDLRNWVKNSTPFRSSPGGNSQERKFYKVASNLVKTGFNDIKTGKLAFDGLNTEIGKLLEGATGGDEFDDWGDGESSFDYDAALSNDTYLSGVEISARANVEAIGQSTDIIASTTAKGFDILAKRNQLNSVIMTSKLAEQLIAGNKITSAINTNLMSIVEQNNEASAFREQQMRFMENTEQNLNDIKEILNNMADMTSQMVPKERNKNYGSNKIDFISGGFDIKEYGRHILENSILGTFIQIGLPMAAPYLNLLGFDTSGIESFGMGGGLKINPLASILKRTRAFKNISKLSSSMENYAKIFFSSLNSRNDMIGLASTFLGLGIDNPVSFRNRPTMSRFDKGIARWDGKDQRALREVIPGYLSKIEANTSILAQQIANLNGDRYLDAVSKNSRFFDEEDGVFKSYKNLADELQSSLDNAAVSAASGFTDMISSVINGADSTKESIAEVLQNFFNRSGWMEKEDIYQLGTIIKKNLAEVSDTDMSKDAKLVRELRSNPDSFKNFIRSLVDELDKGKIDLIDARDRTFRDIGTRSNAVYSIMDDRSGLTKSPYDAVHSSDPRKAKPQGLYSKYDYRFIVSNKEQQEMMKRANFANMTQEEIEAYETQQRQSEALDDVGEWFKNTWLGKQFHKLKKKVQNHEVTREIKNRNLGWITNPAQNLLSSLTHSGVDYNYFNNVSFDPDPTTNAQNPGGGGQGVDRISGLAPNNPKRCKVRRRKTKGEGVGNISNFENREYNSADTQEEAQATALAEIADNVRDTASATIEQNTKLFGKNGMLTQLLQNSAIGKLFQKMKDAMFGVKGEDGFYTDGPLSDIANFAVDNRRGIRRIFTGKGYTDSAGNVYEDTDDAVFKHISKGANSVRTNILVRYLGEDYRNSETYDELPNFMKDKEDRVHHQPQNSNTRRESDTDIDSMNFDVSDSKNDRSNNSTSDNSDLNYDAQTVDETPSTGNTVDATDNEKPAKINLTSDVDDDKKEKVLKSRMQTLRDSFNDPKIDTVVIKIGGAEYAVSRDNYNELMDAYTKTRGELEPSTMQKQVKDSVSSISDKVKKAAPIAITGALAGVALHAASSGGLVSGAANLIPSILGVGGPIGAIIAGAGIALATRSNTFIEKVFGKDDGEGNKVGGIISDKFQKTLKKKMPYIVAGGALGALKGIFLPSLATTGMGAIPAALFGGVLGPTILGIGTGLILSSEKLKEQLFGKDNGDGTRSGGPLSKFSGKSGEAIKSRVLKQLGGGAAGAGIALLIKKSATSGLPTLMGPIAMGIMGASLGIAAAGPKFNEFIFGTKNLDKDGNVIGRNKDGLIDKAGNYLKVNLINPIAVWGKHMFGEIGSYLRDNIKDNLAIIFEALKTPLEDALESLKDMISKIGGGITKLARKILSPIVKLSGSLVKGLLKGGMNSLELVTKITGGIIAAPLNAAGFIINAGEHLKDPKSLLDMVKYRFTRFNDKYDANRKDGKGRFDSFFSAANESLGKKAALESRAEWAEKTGNGVFKAAAQKALDKYETKNRRKDDKNQKSLSNKITKWAKSDRYDETVSLSEKQVNSRKDYIAKKTGLDTKDWTQQDIKNFMYSSQVRSGNYAEFKTVAQQAQEAAAKEKEREAKEDKTRENIITITDTVQAIPQDIHDATDAIIRTLNGVEVTGEYGQSDEITSGTDLNDVTRMGQLEDQEQKKEEKKKEEKTKRDAEEEEQGKEARSLGDKMREAFEGASSSSDDDTDEEDKKEKKEKSLVEEAFDWISNKVGIIGKIVGAIGIPAAIVAVLKNPEKVAEFIKGIPTAVGNIINGIETIFTKLSNGIDILLKQTNFDGMLYKKDNIGDALATTFFGVDDKTESRSKTGVDKYGNEYGIRNSHLTGSIANLGSRFIRRLNGDDLYSALKSNVTSLVKKGQANFTGNVLYKAAFGETYKEATERIAKEAAEAVAKENLAKESAEFMSKAMTTGLTTIDDVVVDNIKAVPVKAKVRRVNAGDIKAVPVKARPVSSTVSATLDTVGTTGISAWDDVVTSRIGIEASEAAIENVDNLAASALKLASESAEEAATSNFTKIWNLLTEGIEKSMEKHAAKGVGKGAIKEVTSKLKDFIVKNKDKLRKAIQKNATKINKAAADSAVEAAAKTTTPIGWAIIGVCAVWDVTTGALDAANLFYVREEDVDWKMRVVSSILKTLIGLSLIASLIDVATEIFTELSGVDLKTALAVAIYKAMSNDEDDIKLDAAQAKFRTDLQDYNELHNTNLSLKTYNEMENARTGQKVWNSIKSVFKPKTAHNISTRSELNLVNSKSEIDQINSSVEYQASHGDTIGFGDLSTGHSQSGDQYSQEDSRWRNVHYGRTRNGINTTIGTGGCGPTALANVYRNITGRKDITPTTIANMAVDSGYTSNGGSNAGLFTEGASRIGLMSQRIDVQDIPSRLMAGQSVIMSGVKRGSGSPYTKSGHIISASGIKNGKIVVNDPLKSNSSLMTVNDVMSGINKAWAIDGSHGFGDTQINNDLLGYGPFTWEISTNKYIPTNAYQMERHKFKIPFGSSFFNWGDDAIYYSQLDDNWSSKKLNVGSIGNSGCYLTSLAMAMSNLTGGIDFDPGTLSVMFPGDSNGVLGSETDAMASLINAKFNRIDLNTSDENQYEIDLKDARTNIKELLKNGYPVIIGGTTAAKKYEDMTSSKSPEFFPHGHLASFLDGHSTEKNSGHFTMLIGANDLGEGNFLTFLFNPGRSVSEKNAFGETVLNSKGIKCVNVDDAIDNYLSGDSVFGKLKSYRYFSRSGSMTEESVAKLWRNLQEYCGITADGEEDISDSAGNEKDHPYRSKRYKEIITHFKLNGVNDVNDIKAFNKYKDKLATASLASDEVDIVHSGSTNPIDLVDQVSESYEPTWDLTTEGTSSTSSNENYNEDGTEKTIFDRVGEIFSNINTIALRLMNSILTGGKEKYTSIYDNNWTFSRDNNTNASSHGVSGDPNAYISFGVDENGNPIVVPASMNKNDAVSEAIKLYTRAKVYQYGREVLGTPQNKIEGKIWDQFKKDYASGNLTEGTEKVPNKYREFYLKFSTEIANSKKSEFEKLYDSAKGNLVDVDGNPITTGTTNVSSTSATSSATSSNGSFPSWATKFTGIYSRNDGSQMAKSSRLSREQLDDMAFWLFRSIGVHERGLNLDNMSESEIDYAYFTPHSSVGGVQESRSTFGIGGFLGTNAAEVIERLAVSGQLNESESQEAHKWAELLYKKPLNNAELTSFAEFMKRKSVRSSLKTIEDAYASQLIGKYLNRAIPYFDNGTINDPRSVLLTSELYPLSNSADFLADLKSNFPNISPENELSKVRENIHLHMRGNGTSEYPGWSKWNSFPGWNRRIWNNYHMLTQNGASGYTDTGLNDSFGIINPTPDSIKSMIPNEAEGYGNIDLKNNFKSYSTYKSTIKNKPLRLAEMGSGSNKSSGSKPLSITANRSYTPATIKYSEGYGRGVDMGPMESKTDRVISLLERVASNTGRRTSGDTNTTINNYSTTNNNSSIGYGDLTMNSGGKGDTIIVNGNSQTPSDMQYSDKLRKLHEKIARSPRH